MVVKGKGGVRCTGVSQANRDCCQRDDKGLNNRGDNKKKIARLGNQGYNTTGLLYFRSEESG